LLSMFSEWHKSDNRNRHIALRKSVLSVLKNLTNLSQFLERLLFVIIAVKFCSFLHCF